MRASPEGGFTWSQGAIIRGDSTIKTLAIVFSADSFAEGADWVLKALRDEQVRASFFFTGNFYRNKAFGTLIRRLRAEGHYLGAHSDRHLLYCDWNRRDSLLVSREEFEDDLLANYREMERFGIHRTDAPYFLPPFEWYNDSIAAWTRSLGFQLVNYTPGTLSYADYTWPGLKQYRGSSEIFRSITKYEKSHPAGLGGFILLSHIGTDPRRQDKFYRRLPDLIKWLKARGYHFCRIDSLLGPENGFH